MSKNELPHGDGSCRRIAVICPDSAADASYFAAALARYVATVVRTDPRRVIDPVVLIDGQPGAGAIDVIIDIDRVPGARWPALAGAGLDIDTDKLLAALPQRDGVGVLSHTRSVTPIDEAVTIATCGAIASRAAGMVLTSVAYPPPSALVADCVIVLVRGTVASMAGGEQVMEALDGDLPTGIVALEANQDARHLIAEALGAPVIGAAPTRWRMGSQCGEDVLEGRWPGEGDRTMERLVRDASMFAAGVDRSLSWA